MALIQLTNTQNVATKSLKSQASTIRMQNISRIVCVTKIEQILKLKCGVFKSDLSGLFYYLLFLLLLLNTDNRLHLISRPLQSNISKNGQVDIKIQFNCNINIIYAGVKTYPSDSFKMVLGKAS